MNALKQRLWAGETTIGLWQALASPYAAEVCAGTGFDWLLFDGEHAPNSVPLLLAQLQAVSAYPVAPVARVAANDPVLIKQYLDIGFQTLLVPMVDSAEQARALVSASRYPPNGIRGVASAISRASNFGARSDYLASAGEEVCLFAQIESAQALGAVAAIAAVDGLDGLFVGPSDLAASLGHLGNPRHPEVQAAIDTALAAILAAGKVPGIFALDLADARKRVDQGFRFVSIGSDISLLARSARELRNAIGG